MRKHFASLRVRLLLLVILAFVPSVILTVYSAAEQRRNAEEEVMQTALRLVRLATSNQDQLVEGARQLLVALAALPAVQTQDSRSCNSFLEALLAQYPLYANIWVVDALEEPGDVFCSGLPFTQQVNVASAPYYLQTLAARDFTGGEYAQEPIAGSAVLPFGYPVPPGWDNPHAVVFAGIDLNWLNGFVSQAGLPPDSTLSVIDRNGRILARYPDPEDAVGSTIGSSALQPLLAESEGIIEEVGRDGVTRIYAFKVLCCLASGDVYVRIGIPKAVAFAEPDRVLRRNLWTLGGVSLFALLAAYFGGNLTVVREVQSLVRTTQRLAAGDFGARTGLSQYGGEFGQLAASLDQMAGALEVREAERLQAEAALRLHSARTEALAKIAARLNAHLELQSVLSLVCHETASALAVSAASVSLYDESLDLLRIVSYCGLPEDFDQWIEELEWSTCTEPLKAGETVVVPDVLDSPELPTASLFAALDIRSFVTTPMMHEQRLVGTLCVFMRGQVRGFTQDELAFLKAISDQAAQAIANARLYEALGQEQHLCAGLLERVISAQEEERKRIARELHDDTSQGLTASILSLDAAEMALRTDGPKTEEHVATAREILGRVLDSIQRLMRDLRPALLDDLGLIPAIKSHAEERLVPQGISFSVEGQGTEGRLPSVMETALFRIAQEAITNIVKHSGASEVLITLNVRNGKVLLVVKDNGAGFDVSSVSTMKRGGRGLGLHGMQERATILGGKCQIESTAGRGTMVLVEVPSMKVGGENG
jgi:signal transduction histidine kinase/HAMP domain-containing protein